MADLGDHVKRRRKSISAVTDLFIDLEWMLAVKWRIPGTNSEWNLVLQSTMTNPAIISKMSTPTAHQSTAESWPIPVITSGAKYSGVPHNVHVLKERVENGKLRVESTDHAQF